jgi:hypothetical protein
MQNAHVILFLRWQVWCARRAGRLMAQTFWTQWHNEELAKSPQAE